MPLSLTRRLHGHIIIIHKGLTSSQHASKYQKKKKKEEAKDEKWKKGDKTVRSNGKSSNISRIRHIVVNT